MSAPVITLTTDFGHDDPYVGAMCGAILTLAPEAKLVDISHGVPPHDIRAGAFTLASAAPYFPAGTVHLAVVDPGVGTARRGLVAETGRFFFVGPDNGLFTAVFEREPPRAIHAIERLEYGLSPIHPTFHGRDLFGPIAARLAAGTLRPAELGPAIADPVRLHPPRPAGAEGGTLELPVLHVDRFGNVTLALHEDELRGRALPNALTVAGAEIPLRRTYGELPAGTLLALWGSAGHLELAVCEGNAADRLGVSPGALVSVRLS